MVLLAGALALAGCAEEGAPAAPSATGPASRTTAATPTATPTAATASTTSPAPASSATSAPVTTAPAAALAEEEPVRLRGTEGSFTYDVLVPRFAGPAEVDRRVLASAQHAVDAARGSVAAGDPPRTFGGRGTVPTNDGRTVQVRYEFVDSTEGTAHPTGSVSTVALDARDGSPITLDELFEDEAAALSTLAGEVERIAAERGEDVDPAGLEPVPATFAAWQTTPEGMALSFQDFQLGGHGVREYAVSWDVLEELVTPAAYDLLGPVAG